LAVELCHETILLKGGKGKHVSEGIAHHIVDLKEGRVLTSKRERIELKKKRKTI